MDIDHKVIFYHLKIGPKFVPYKQKRKAFNSERYETSKGKVEKLIANGFIKEAVYPKCVSYLVLVKKNNGNYRVCIDFSNLN